MTGIDLHATTLQPMLRTSLSVAVRLLQYGRCGVAESLERNLIPIKTTSSSSGVLRLFYHLSNSATELNTGIGQSYGDAVGTGAISFAS